MKISVSLQARSYDILLERGLLDRAGSLLELRRKVLLVTDDGVPLDYAARVARQCGAPVFVMVPAGEASKNLACLQKLCKTMLDAGFRRTDCVVALGGGMVGDLAGYAAASYMRGIDFYNIPTTLLAQADASVGGKVAVNLGGIKNIVGAFWQPKRVLIDPDTLRTLPERQLASGFAEIIKMACTSDAALFARMETEPLLSGIDGILAAAIRIKKAVVEQDETEAGPRKLLNFGHTIGHGIESLGGRLHGECVALGMLPMCSDAVRARLVPLLRKAGLPTGADYDRERVWQAMQHDKKAAGSGIDIVVVETLGHGELRRVPAETLQNILYRTL